MDIRFKVVPKLKPIYSATQRYIIAYGGRGGAKSFEYARLIITDMATSSYPMRILCAREIQTSIKESVYALLVQAIYDLGIQDEFEILANAIRSRRVYDRGLKSEIFFKGVKNNIYDIKSMANLDRCWVEEAANVSQESWDILLPTVRAEGSRMLISFNTTTIDSPTYKLFVDGEVPKVIRIQDYNGRVNKNILYIEQNESIKFHYINDIGEYKTCGLEHLGIRSSILEGMDREFTKAKIRQFIHEDENLALMQELLFTPPDERLLININYWDNPYISDTLYAEMRRMKKNDYEAYLHHWEGLPLTLSNAVIFKGKFKVQELEEEYFYSQKTTQYKGKIVKFKYGMDFGFATDPFACVECFMQDGKIYITRELYWHGMENVDITPMLEKTMPELVKERRRVYADSAYPATISQLAKIQMHPNGYKIEPLNIQGAVKGKGSVEEGINWLRGFEIIVDPSCKNMIYELSNYKYKTDRDTGEIIPIPEDKNNHLVDSLRYAFNEEITALRGAEVRAIVFKKEHERRRSPIWND